MPILLLLLICWMALGKALKHSASVLFFVKKILGRRPAGEKNVTEWS